jgi:hypothetical protein
MEQKLWNDTVNGNPDFSAELRSLIGGDDTPLSKLETAIQNYRNTVEVVSIVFGSIDNAGMHKVVRSMRPFQISLQETSNSLLRWRDEVNPRIAARRQTL